MSLFRQEGKVKKLIFLLILAFAFAGFVSAGDAYPPGDVTLEAALSENSGYEAVVASDTVLVLATPAAAEPSSLQAVMALYNESAIQPQSGYIIMSNLIKIEQPAATADYYLRC